MKPLRALHQLALEDVFLPFAGKPSGDDWWRKMAKLIPCDDQKDDCAPQFCKGFGAPFNPF